MIRRWRHYPISVLPFSSGVFSAFAAIFTITLTINRCMKFQRDADFLYSDRKRLAIFDQPFPLSRPNRDLSTDKGGGDQESVKLLELSVRGDEESGVDIKGADRHTVPINNPPHSGSSPPYGVETLSLEPSVDMVRQRGFRCSRLGRFGSYSSAGFIIIQLVFLLL